MVTMSKSEQCKQWRQSHRDYASKSSKQWRALNHGHMIAYGRQYYLENQKTLLAKAWSERLLNPEKFKARAKRSRMLHSKEWAAKRRVARRLLRARMFALLGNACVVCGVKDSRILQIDHKHGNGNQIRKLVGHGSVYDMYSYYLVHPAQACNELQILCANCNWKKKCLRNENKTGNYLEKPISWRSVHRRSLLIRLLGGKCIMCGTSDKDVLQLDHIAGNGASDKHVFVHNYQMFKYYYENPTVASRELQVLCASCNWIKRHEKGEQGGRNIDTAPILILRRDRQ